MATTKNGNDTPNLEQLTSEYFESIKGNHAALRQFFTAMPKGGDVHNHLTGSAYAETYFELAAKKGMYVNPETGRLYAQKPMEVETIQLSKDMDDLHNHRMALIDKWSIRNFQPYKYPLGPDEYFFGTFGLLSALTGDAENLACLMHELKVRAVKENVQYLEVMATSPSVPTNCLPRLHTHAGPAEQPVRPLRCGHKQRGVPLSGIQFPWQRTPESLCPIIRSTQSMCERQR